MRFLLCLCFLLCACPDPLVTRPVIAETLVDTKGAGGEAKTVSKKMVGDLAVFEVETRLCIYEVACSEAKKTCTIQGAVGAQPALPVSDCTGIGESTSWATSGKGGGPVCTKGKACGDACIALDKTCRK